MHYPGEVLFRARGVFSLVLLAVMALVMGVALLVGCEKGKEGFFGSSPTPVALPTTPPARP